MVSSATVLRHARTPALAQGCWWVSTLSSEAAHCLAFTLLPPSGMVSSLPVHCLSAKESIGCVPSRGRDLSSLVSMEQGREHVAWKTLGHGLRTASAPQREVQVGAHGPRCDRIPQRQAALSPLRRRWLCPTEQRRIPSLPCTGPRLCSCQSCLAAQQVNAL